MVTLSANCSQNVGSDEAHRFHRESDVLVYKMIAERETETMKCERVSSLIVVAKARVWVSEGWDVTITDGDGKVFAPSEFENLLAT